MASYLDNKELTQSAIKDAASAFNNYASARKDYETIWKTSDYMYKCAQNRSIAKSEREKGANLADNAERANTGSTLFYRQVNQLHSSATAILRSQDVPLKFKPIINEGVFLSPQDGMQQSDQWNCLLKWNLKQDDFPLKSAAALFGVTKYGNIPVLVEWVRREELRSRFEPVHEIVINPATGEPEVVQTGLEEVTKPVTTKNYFSFRTLQIDSLFADPYIPNLNDQNVVVVLTLNNKATLLERAKAGIYDLEITKNLGPQQMWDGTTNKPLLQEKLKNEGITNTTSGSDSKLFLTYDIFIRYPIVDGKFNEVEGDHDWRLITVVGNTIENGTVLRFDDNEDPDHELPIYMIHDKMDDEDFLYHMSRAQAVRSNYSVECTLKNQMIDNGALANRPPMKEIEGGVRGTDRTWNPNATFIMDTQESLMPMPVSLLGQHNSLLLEYIKSDTKTALNTDNLMMGESAGARTSAYEISKLDKYSSTPHLVDVEYVLYQFLTFYGRKFLSYWRKYRLPEQVLAITDENILKEIKPDNLHGEFDIEIDIVNEYQADMVDSAALDKALTMITQNPAFTANVDVAELLTEWFKKNHLHYTKIIRRPLDSDATEMATAENVMMMEGIPVHPKQGENDQIHINVHKSERIQYDGVEAKFPNVVLLDQHIAETEQKMQQSASAPMMGQNTGSPEMPMQTQGGGMMQEAMGGPNAVGATSGA